MKRPNRTINTNIIFDKTINNLITILYRTYQPNITNRISNSINRIPHKFTKIISNNVFRTLR